MAEGKRDRAFGSTLVWLLGVFLLLGLCSQQRQRRERQQARLEAQREESAERRALLLLGRQMAEIVRQRLQDESAQVVAGSLTWSYQAPDSRTAKVRGSVETQAGGTPRVRHFEATVERGRPGDGQWSCEGFEVSDQPLPGFQRRLR